jgi:lysophospholipase L1-like esterase
MLIVNYTNYDASLDSLTRKDTYDIEESIKAIYHPLKGKNIVCFGDSITQFSENGMRYSDYLEEMGASIVNVGIGGTQIRQRATPSASPTSVEQAYGGLDMASLASAVANNDYAIAEASAAYVQNNSAPQYNPQEVIERLKAIDWSKIDAVTILGGTNDWNNGNNLGEATDESASSTLGALNYIIKSLLTAHPHIKVYCFTPLVRYVASTLAERTDATWAGNMENSEGKTLLDYVDAIKYVAESNCIPVCDMYRTMGWNKYNFSQYFNDNDGVHPYKGFKGIADRMQSFILSNL